MRHIIAIIAILFCSIPLNAQNRAKQDSLNSLPKTIVYKNTNEKIKANIFYVPANDIIVVQAIGLVKQNITVNLYDSNNTLMQQKIIYQGSTVTFLDTRTLYDATYKVSMTINGVEKLNKEIQVISK